jgi:hypothetical protein
MYQAVEDVVAICKYASRLASTSVALIQRQFGLSGSAAWQCGKALPFRLSLLLLSSKAAPCRLRGVASQEIEVAQAGKPEAFRTDLRHSRLGLTDVNLNLLALLKFLHPVIQ